MDAPRTERHLVLIRVSGDVSTKAHGTLERFSRRIASNVEDALTSAGLAYHLERGRFRLLLEVDTLAALDPLLRVFGIQSLSALEQRRWETLEDIVREGETAFRERVEGKRFAVRARRSGEIARIGFRSPEVERALGRALLPHAAQVDLGHPQVTAYVDVHPGVVYFYDHKLPGKGGLPVGIEGRAVSLISGGFDSAVASWLLLKRGVALDYLFLNLGGRAHREGVLRVAKVLSDQWSYGDRPRFFEVDFAPVVNLLRESVAPRYWQLVLKRLMLRAGEELATQLGGLALVTGEAVGQVSSQTLPNLAAIAQGIRIPVFRPLLGFNKDEILDLAREIGTFAFSSKVEEYCAILPRHPVTHASPEAVSLQEGRMDARVLAPLLAPGPGLDLRGLTLPSGEPSLEVEDIPPGSTVLDLRSALAHRAWHYPGAHHLDFFQAMKTYRSFDPSQTYVLYCEVGQKSAHLAELLAEAGFRAVHVKDGVRRLLQRSEEAHLLLS